MVITISLIRKTLVPEFRHAYLQWILALLSLTSCVYPQNITDLSSFLWSHQLCSNQLQLAIDCCTASSPNPPRAPANTKPASEKKKEIRSTGCVPQKTAVSKACCRGYHSFGRLQFSWPVCSISTATDETQTLYIGEGMIQTFCWVRRLLWRAWLLQMDFTQWVLGKH